MKSLLIWALMMGTICSVVADGALGTRLPWEKALDHQEWSQVTLKALPTPTYKPSKMRYDSVRGKGAYIAFTFDDGPRPWTNQVLDALKERNLKATFYVVGKEALYYPKIIKRIADEGHEFGNHTFNHILLNRDAGPTALKIVEHEIRLAHETILKLSGIAPLTLRPPGGRFTREQDRWLQDTFGYANILWSVDPGDGRSVKPSPATFEKRVMSQVHNGAIILSHDLWKSTVAAVPSTLDALLARGYEFLTVSELLALDDPYEVVPFTDEDLKALQQDIAAGN